MVEKTLKNFDLEQIAHSGQCFRMKQTGGCRFEVVAYGKRLIIRQSGEQVTFFCTEREYNDLWRRYFDIETNYRYYIDHIDPEDGFLTAAARLGGGIRILRQDLWEVLVSFIISQNNSIPRITASIETLCRTCGKKHLAAPEGVVWWEFPGPEAWQMKQTWKRPAWGTGRSTLSSWHRTSWTERWTWKPWRRMDQGKRRKLT